MGVRGEVVIECDVKGCHAELVLSAERVEANSARLCAQWDGWARSPITGAWMCEQCLDEGKTLR